MVRRLVVAVLFATAVAGIGGVASAAPQGPARVCTLSFNWTAGGGVTGSGACIGSDQGGVVSVTLQEIASERPGSGCPRYYQFNVLGLHGDNQLQWVASYAPLRVLTSGPVHYPDPAKASQIGGAVLLGPTSCAGPAPSRSVHGMLVLTLTGLSV